jgi:Zn-dependent protease
MECFIIVTVLWVFSVCLHEFAHAWVAYQGGDLSVAEKGYLTLNPFRYTHPILSLLLPVLFMMLGGIGLPGGAVYIDRSRLRSRTWNTAVALAGPAMNLALIVLLGALFKTGVIPADRANLATLSMAFFLRLQVYSVLLNLIPLPPLDGYQAIAPWLPAEWQRRISGAGNIIMVALFLVLFSVPVVNRLLGDAEQAVSGLFGVQRIWGYLGYRAFKFWEN